jgi:hypothetical protein
MANSNSLSSSTVKAAKASKAKAVADKVTAEAKAVAAKVTAEAKAKADLASFKFYYEVDLTNQQPKTKGGSVTLAAYTAEGGVIKCGSHGTWGENLLPSIVYYNEAKATEGAGADWVKKSFDDILHQHFLDLGRNVQLLRFVKGASGKFDVIAPHLLEGDDNMEIMNAQIKLDLDFIYLDGVKTEVDEETFLLGERKFKAIRIYFDDLSLGAVTTNPNTALEMQNLYLTNYQVHAVSQSLGSPMGLASVAGKVGAPSESKVAKGATTSRSALLEKLANRKASGIGTVTTPSITTEGSAINASANVAFLNAGSLKA